MVTADGSIINITEGSNLLDCLLKNHSGLVTCHFHMDPSNESHNLI